MPARSSRAACGSPPATTSRASTWAPGQLERLRAVRLVGRLGRHQRPDLGPHRQPGRRRDQHRRHREHHRHAVRRALVERSSTSAVTLANTTGTFSASSGTLENATHDRCDHGGAGTSPSAGPSPTARAVAVDSEQDRRHPRLQRADQRRHRLAQNNGGTTRFDGGLAARPARATGSPRTTPERSRSPTRTDRAASPTTRSRRRRAGR